MPKRKAKPVVKTPQNKKAKTSKTKPTQKTDKRKKNTNVKSAKMSSGQKTTLDKKGPKKSAEVVSASSGSLNLKDLLTDPQWTKALSGEFVQDYYKQLEDTLAKEYAAEKEIFPPKDLIFNAFNLTPFDKVKVVILGQDPYHDNGQAMGLSFSVPLGIPPPPSLKNMYAELERDPKIVGFKPPDHGCLEQWAKEGILLLNATLTVEAHKPNSHAKFGWLTFTDNVIKLLNEKTSGVVFILWGNFAHKKEKLIDTGKHGIVKTAHPSPLSIKHFRACNCFSDCNDKLKSLGKKPVSWNLS